MLLLVLISKTCRRDVTNSVLLFRARFYSTGVYGADLKNIVTLTTLNEATVIAKRAVGNSVCIIGSSFIAMELAESLSRIALHVHILSRGKAPYGLVLGETTGKAILQHFLLSVKNVTFHCTDDVYCFQGNPRGEVVRVLTMKKRTLPAELVVIAIGGIPNTDFLLTTPLKIHPIDHSILVNKVS